jgi:hypothetical protein
LAEIFGVQPLGNMLPRQHLNPSTLPPGPVPTVSRISWRGIMVNLLRASETKGGKNYVTYNVQIPLKVEAIQLILGAPAAHEPELKTRMETLLASLDGPSDW